MKNILATSVLPKRRFGINLTAVALALSMIGSTLWGVWATDKLLALEKREVVTVQLSRIMGDFIEAEARAGRPPEETRQRVQAYLRAVEDSGTPGVPGVAKVASPEPAEARSEAILFADGSAAGQHRQHTRQFEDAPCRVHGQVRRARLCHHRLRRPGRDHPQRTLGPR